MAETATEPRVTFHKEARSITVDHLIKVDHEGRNGSERRHYATLSVRYDKGGANYFSGNSTPRSYTSSIARETEEIIYDKDGKRIGAVRGYKLFHGLRLKRSDPVKRYSEKALREFFGEAKAHLDAVRDDPQVAKYFDPEEDGDA